MSWNVKSTFHNQEVPQNRSNWSSETFKDFHETSANFSATPISCLTPAILKPSVAGVIIHKGDLRSFTSKKDSSEKFVLEITIRDSPKDFISVSCWGHYEFINGIDTDFQIGQAVKMDNLVVQLKPVDGTYEKFKPCTPGMYVLNLFETRGVIVPWLGDDMRHFVHIPVKNPVDYHTIFDITSNTPEGALINILSIVKEVGVVKEFTGKSGKQLRRREVSLFDDTASELILTIWNEGYVRQSQLWKPKETVIFGADLKVSYNKYKSKMTVSTTSKSIITEDPESREAFLLSRYARTVDFDCPSLNNQSGVVFDEEALKCVTERKNIKEVKRHIGASAGELYCVLWAHLTCLPIDQAVLHRCQQCHKVLTDPSSRCSCITSCNFNEEQAPVNLSSPFYGLRVSLADSTGSLQQCHLPSCVLEKMLDMQAESFKELDQATKTALKWQYMMERVRVIIHVGGSLGEQGKVEILSVSLLHSDEEFNQTIAQL